MKTSFALGYLVEMKEKGDPATTDRLLACDGAHRF